MGISMEGIDALMKHVYVFPLMGLVLGSIFGAAAFLFSRVLPGDLVAILVIIIIYKLCGINHIDGLADFGDGVVAHGPIDKKVQAMKDVNLGTGGVFFIIVILLATFSLISSMPLTLLPLSLIGAEVSAKQSMIAFAAFSKSLQKGFGQIMIERTDKRDFLIGLAIAAALCVALLSILGLVALAASQIVALYLVEVSKRNFGGSTGDGIGATNEICRVVALSVVLTLWGVVPWKPW